MPSEQLEIIDAQLHEPAIHFDWSQDDASVRRRVLDEVLVAYLDAVGVDRAVLFPADLDWATHLAATATGRFAIVPALAPGGHLRSFTPRGVVNRLDPLAPDIDLRIAQFVEHHPCLGFRMMARRTLPGSLANRDPVELFSPVLAACEQRGLAIFMSSAGDAERPRSVARAFPGLTLVIDHLGIPQPPTFTRDDPPFARLDTVLAMAEEHNIMVKLSGAPTLSQRPYPFGDLWPHLAQLIDAFGPDRLMWGSDISRIQGRIGHELRIFDPGVAYAGLHTYAEAVFYMRHTDQLSEDQKRWIMGGTIRNRLKWPNS